MQIQAIGLTDVGLVRKGNEDYFLIDETLKLYIVCDGMGGHNAGEVASQNAAEITRSELQEQKELFQTCDGSASSYKQVVNAVRRAVQKACKEVYDKARKNSEYKGMGTTLTLMLSLGNKGLLAHVGDSRLYLQRGDKLFKLTTDHTLAAGLVAQGALTPEEGKHHATSNILTRAIGLQPSVKVDILLFDLMPDDTFLLCSDGMDSIQDPTELATILQADDPTIIPSVLIELAKERDGSDNITALIGRVTADKADPKHEAWIREVQLRIDTLRKVPLFHYLDFRELTHVIELLKVTKCNAGDILIQEGEASDSLYITLEGELSISRAGQELAILSAGSHVGEMALLNNAPRSATVRAVEPSRLLKIERESFFQLIREQPKIGVKLMWSLAQTLSQRLDQTNTQASNEPIHQTDNTIPPPV